MAVLLQYFFALSLFVWLCQQPASGGGVTLKREGKVLKNFDLLSHLEIGTANHTHSDDKLPSLVCRTDNDRCCSNPYTMDGQGFGNWYYPDGSKVFFPYERQLSGQIYRMRRGWCFIQLRRDMQPNITTAANGIYHCEVANMQGINQTRYVGLYTDGAGAISILKDPQFSLTSTTDPLEFTLTVNTTGGPPTTAFWTLPSGVDVAADDDSFSQRLVDGTTSTVEHTLTVAYGLTGKYTFTTANSRSNRSSACTTVEGIYLEHNGSRIPNFYPLYHSDVSGDGDFTNQLICRTDNTSCCRRRDNPNGVGFGDWYYPDGSLVHFLFEGLPTDQIYLILRLNRTIRLRRNGSDTASTANGIYRCELPNQNNVIQTRYVGLYTDGAGMVSIFQAPQFSLISVDPLEFTLTSTTTGGPPTTAFWTLPDMSFVNPGDTFSQRVVDAVASTVEHTLTVTGRVTGTYTFSTTNVRRGAPDSRNIVIEAANPPSGLMVVQSGLTSVDVSWTAPAPGGATLTGYRIFYETGGSEQSVDVGAGAISHTLTGLQSGATYSITIVALSSTLPSTLLEPEMVILQVLDAPVVTTEVLSPTSIRITFTQPSGSPAERYDIQYTRVTEAGQTLCDGVEDIGCITDVQSPYTITNLEEFSNYSITVTAYACSLMQNKTIHRMTSLAAPTAAPQDLMSTTVNSTSITVGWNPVECIERNGVIDNYIVRFGPESGAQNESTIQSEGIDQPGTYTASGLTSSTRYSFQVAAVNSEGTGPFTPFFTVMTDVLSPPANLTAVQTDPKNNSVNVSWISPLPSDSPDAIIGYRIAYSTGGDIEHCVYVAANATSHTLTDLESGAMYSITIVARINENLSTAKAGPVMVNLSNFEPPIVMAEELSSTSINVTFTQPNGSLAAERYVIEWFRVTGAGQALCPYFEDNIKTRTDMPSPQLLERLEAFSNYTIRVTAHFPNCIQKSAEIIELTLPDEPEAPPKNINFTVTSTTITLYWEPVPCKDRNGVIDNYIVQYKPADADGAYMRNEIMSEGINQTGNYTIMGLTPSTNYSISVAAMNTKGIGANKTLNIMTASANASIESVVVWVDTAVIIIAWNWPSTQPSNNGIEYNIMYCSLTNDIMCYNASSQDYEMNDCINTSNRDTCIVLEELKPSTTYNITIEPTNIDSSEETSIIATTLPIPKVSGFKIVKAADPNVVEVSWFAVNIPHTDVYYELQYRVLSPSHSSGPTTMRIEGEQVTAEVDVAFLDKPGLEYIFSVAAGYEAQGESCIGDFSDPKTFVNDERIFEFWLSPVDNCATWSSDTAASLRHDIHAALALHISEQCCCSFPEENIKDGAFRCWSSTFGNEVFYRGTLRGTRQRTAEQLLSYTNAWADSAEAVVQKENGVELKVFRKNGREDVFDNCGNNVGNVDAPTSIPV